MLARYEEAKVQTLTMLLELSATAASLPATLAYRVLVVLGTLVSFCFVEAKNSFFLAFKCSSPSDRFIEM